ncbi:condensin-2 complex subunit H2 isoform X2 [Phascolarctos cinereus]|nr:condensin-2 complex subunit H2 isoform X2 [Phascolarctos cinereus]XP_020838520.1 condensin-2 complex subunit H2 isoform X2 [Phascolarctos cinereus]
MNFIEAALLIQGSACVYSKKVEYLYSLVYQALDFISGKKRSKQATSVQPDGQNTDDSGGARPEPEEEFLSLDDLPDSRANIDLKNDHSSIAVPVIPLVPMALVPPDEEEKKSNPLYSRRGEVLASRKDFRMNTSSPHPSGAFLLEPGGLSPMEQILPRTQLDAERPEEMPMDVSVCMSPAPVLNFSQEDDEKLEAALPEGEEEVGGDLLLDPEAPEACPLSPEPGTQQQGTLESSRYPLRGRTPATTPQPSGHQKEPPDPWQSLDPFDSLEGKPFKKGSPYSLPQHLETSSGKRKRKTSSRLQGFHEWYLAAYSGCGSSQKPRHRGPTFADLEALYWKHVKEQVDALRKLRRGEVAEQQPSKAQEGLWALEEERVEESPEHLGGEDSFLELEDAEPAEPLEGVPEPEAIGPLNYEELVQRNVELFIANSQKYVHETELSQRIQDWEDTIGPLLQEQEEHVPFDIHNYGDQVVASFQQLNEWCPFAELVAGKPAFEVCRSMLASLQLANDYTVEITQKPGLAEAVDTMSLRLLTRQRAHERFQTYTAPSMALP